jgi:signal transduction histidine kinase
MEPPAHNHDTTQLLAEREFLIRALLETAERERRRIGQQLHDEICQLLVGAAFGAKAVAHSLPASSPAAAELDDLVRLINHAAQQTRSLTRELDALHFDARDFTAAMRKLGEGRPGGIPCRLEFDPSPPPIRNAPSALQLYRIAQEAITNATQHSGAAEIVVRVIGDGEGMQLQIADNGCGFDEGTHSGLGLAMMKYRAEAIGADLRIDTSTEAGTCVTCSLPKIK